MKDLDIIRRMFCRDGLSLSEIERRTGLKRQLTDKLIEHQRYIEKTGEDLPEIRNWQWNRTT